MAAFLSYSSEDEPIARELEQRLSANGVMLHRDKHATRFGGDWIDRVRPLIAESTHLVLVWSLNAWRSPNVMQEVLIASGHGRIVLPVSVDETPLPGFLDRVHSYPYPDMLGELVAALRPPTRGLGGQDVTRIAGALNTVRLAAANQFESFRVLYPGSERAIDESYVPLALVPGVGPEDAHTEYDVLQLIRSATAEPLRMLLLGHPGAGKSTTLQFVAHRLLSEPSQRDELLVFARCKDYRPHLHSSFDQFAYATLRTYAPVEAVDTLAAGDVLCDAGQMLLLDGLDELGPGSYAPFLQRLTEYLEHPSRVVSAVIITTRIDSFRNQEGDFPNWRRLSIKPLDSDRIADFARRWFRRSEDAKPFLERLREPRFAELAARPFLLAMMCLVYERSGTLGKNRSEVLHLAAEYLEERRQELTSDLIARQRRAVLEELAIRSLQMGMIDIDRRVATGIAAARLALPVDGPETPARAAVFLDDIARETGLLQSGGSSYTWLHRSFQEFYAARCLRSWGEGEAEQILVEHAPLPWWEEPIRLYVGATGATSVVPLLRKLWGAKPALALRCLTDVAARPAGLVRELLSLSKPADRVRMLAEFSESVREMEDETTRRRVVLETVEPIFANELDSAVLYHSVQLHRSVDPGDTSELMEAYFYSQGRELHDRLLSDRRCRFELIDVARGEFTMGDDGGFDPIERPAHRVRLTHPFRLQRFQLTRLAYGEIMGQRASNDSLGEHPVVDLSWYDAYVAALRAGCRLPTEAEWEYAARAGTTTAWSCGDEEGVLRKYANYEGDPTTESSTWPVGAREPNPWGFYDVHGNVWEWCYDWLAPYRHELQVDPIGPLVGDARVRRGGGYAYHARGCRSAFRWGNDPGYRFRDIGVRLAADIISVA